LNINKQFKVFLKWLAQANLDYIEQFKVLKLGLLFVAQANLDYIEQFKVLKLKLLFVVQKKLNHSNISIILSIYYYVDRYPYIFYKKYMIV